MSETSIIYGKSNMNNIDGTTVNMIFKDKIWENKPPISQLTDKELEDLIGQKLEEVF